MNLSLLLVGALLAFAIVSVNADIIPASSPLVQWSGRRVVDESDGSVVLDFAAVSVDVTVNNTFTVVKVHIRDTCVGGNKFSVSLSGEGVSQFHIATFYTASVSSVGVYPLFSSPNRASFGGSTASFRLTKNIEARYSQCSGSSNLSIVAFETDSTFLPTAAPTRRLEFIGDSITSGDLVHCQDSWGRRVGVSNSLWADDADAAYGSVLCTNFGAACSTISWGGMGLAANDVPSWTWPTLPDIYPSALAFQVQADGPAAAKVQYPWDFAEFVPDGVVINLGTNDAAGNRFSNHTFAKYFEDRYVTFVQNISSVYNRAAKLAAGRDSNSDSEAVLNENTFGGSSSSSSSSSSSGPVFFLGFGPMSTAYQPSVANVVSRLTQQGITVQALNLTLPAPCQCGHPSVADHQQMAHIAAPVIAAALKWEV